MRDVGLSRLKQGDYAGAETAFRKAVAGDSDDLVALKGLAVSLEKQDKSEAAARAYERLGEKLLARPKGTRVAPQVPGETAPPAAKPAPDSAAKPAARPFRAALPPVAKGDAQLDGVYVPLAAAYGGGRELYYFRPDGYFYYGQPPAGVENLDLAGVAAEHPEQVATYQIKGKQITIAALAGGQPKAAAFEVRDGVTHLGGRELYKGEPFPAGQVLEGRYYGRADVGGARQSWSFTFTKGGKFTSDAGLGLATADARVQGGVRTEGGVVEKAGTYKCGGTTLTLTAADGSVSRCTIVHIPDPKGTTPMYFIDGRLCFHDDK